VREGGAWRERIIEMPRVMFNMTHGHSTLDAGERDLLICAEADAIRLAARQS
jgi:hypothetical protein